MGKLTEEIIYKGLQEEENLVYELIKYNTTTKTGDV